MLIAHLEIVSTDYRPVAELVFAKKKEYKKRKPSGRC
jgi:hypothetical protein